MQCSRDTHVLFLESLFLPDLSLTRVHSQRSFSQNWTRSQSPSRFDIQSEESCPCIILCFSCVNCNLSSRDRTSSVNTKRASNRGQLPQYLLFPKKFKRVIVCRLIGKRALLHRLQSFSSEVLLFTTTRRQLSSDGFSNDDTTV